MLIIVFYNAQCSYSVYAFDANNLSIHSSSLFVVSWKSPNSTYTARTPRFFENTNTIFLIRSIVLSNLYEFSPFDSIATVFLRTFFHRIYRLFFFHFSFVLLLCDSQSLAIFIRLMPCPSLSLFRNYISEFLRMIIKYGN